MIRTPRYLTTDGPTTADDPKRLVWHGLCGMWTDDWNAVSLGPVGIPVCPVCGRVGTPAEQGDWDKAVAAYQANGHPGYINFVNSTKGRCLRSESVLELYRAWLAEHPNGKVNPSPRSDGS